ncbi:GNAT family N-acetyltransferase [Arsenicicoccus cauae]|nr:GNAT family N-acetyltransferase [Arsenicicoccus cauae]
MATAPPDRAPRALHPGAPRTVETARLRLRPPTTADAAFHHALHSDERLYQHAPWAVTTDRTANLVGLQTWVEGWETDGFGYWVAEDRGSGRPVGVVGVRPLAHGEDGVVNLYYRFAHESHGQGLGREAARAATAWAAEWLPGWRARAVARDDNPASGRTAASAGLVPGEPHVIPGDPVEAGPSRAWWLPRVRVVGASERSADPSLRDQMLDLWCAVNAAGGAVGFTRDTPREAVAVTLDDALAATDDELRTLAVLRDHTGLLLGFGWWIRSADGLFRHTATLKRLMVDPAVQGRNLGAVALAGMHAVARTLPGLEVCDLTYRSGLGLGRFYARMGWTEVGRVPRSLWLSADDRRDSVWMVRSVTGASVVAEGSL